MRREFEEGKKLYFQSLEAIEKHKDFTERLKNKMMTMKKQRDEIILM